jgi:DNA-binding transcriptional MerR regulator
VFFRSSSLELTIKIHDIERYIIAKPSKRTVTVTYSIGEIEQISGIKQNVLRYWETVIPGFAPRKDLGGRRVYTERDLEINLRLNYLIYERKFTIEGARNEILRESQAWERQAEAMNAIREIRSELTKIYLQLKK